MQNIEAIFFDLFFTLIIPKYHLQHNENDVLGLSVEEWELYAENDKVYKRRAMGNVNSAEEIINEIVESMPLSVSEVQKEKLIALRKERMKNALINVDFEIVETIQKLHDNGIKICLISNADIIDAMYWAESPLYKLFDDAIFSYEVKCLKPNSDIYDIAIQRMHVNPEKCVFVGDGGSNELLGARRAGMKTVFTEYLDIKEPNERKKIMEVSDYHIMYFTELAGLFL